MTLRNHRSQLIPDIAMGGDGSMFVTDTGGTFPLRKVHGKDRHGPIKDSNDNYTHPPVEPDVTSYRSYDPRRERSKHGFRQREPSRFRREVDAMSGGTWGSSKASINRRKPQINRLRRVESLRKREERHKTFGSMSSRGSGGSGGSGGSVRRPRMRGGTPSRQAHENRMAYSLTAKEIKEIKRLSKKGKSLSNGNALSTDSRERAIAAANGRLPFGGEERKRKLADDKPPGVLFLCSGVLTLLAGVAHLILTPWTLFYSPLWSAALVIIQGIVGVTHRKDYLTRWKNGLYIALGVVASLAAGVTAALIIQLLPRLLSSVSRSENSTLTFTSLTFTKQNSSLVDLLDVRATVVAETALEAIVFVFSLVNFYCLTGSLICLSNHWDARYETTGDCDQRGNPRYFNPMEQVSLGQASAIIGVMSVTLQVSTSRFTYWTPPAACGVVMIAAIFTVAYYKRPDIRSLGVWSLLLQILTLLACGVAIVFTALVMVDDIVTLQTAVRTRAAPLSVGNAAVAVSAAGAFLFCMVVNLVYSVGIVFRQTRRLCCHNRRKNQPEDTYF